MARTSPITAYFAEQGKETFITTFLTRAQARQLVTEICLLNKWTVDRDGNTHPYRKSNVRVVDLESRKKS